MAFAFSELPPIVVDANLFLELGTCLTGSRRERDFRSHFGGPSNAIAYLWTLVRKTNPLLPHLWGAVEMLQSLCYLKSPGVNWATSSSRFNLDWRTLRANLQTTLNVIDSALPDVCFFFPVFFFLFLLFQGSIELRGGQRLQRRPPQSESSSYLEGKKNFQ
jgi:hypothetical protein